jgi:signal transduction histidine kinase
MTIGSDERTVSDMKEPEPEAGRIDPETSRRATRGASLGLAAVVVCLAAFSIIAAYTTQAQVAHAHHLESLDATYDDAITALRAEESAEQEYLLNPSAPRRAAMNDASNAFFNSVNEIEVQGGEPGAKLAKEVLTLHDQYVEASARLIAAVSSGAAVEALRIDVVEVDPIFDEMHDRIAIAAALRHEEADSALLAVDNTARLVLIESPVVFAIGFVLLIGLWRRLDQSHRATRETYREIEQLSKLRSEFVSLVSHEFRTPLTGIQGFSEMIRDEVMSMPEVREYAADINKDARRLARLITDMLDLDRMESGRMTLNSEPVDLNRIVGDTAAQFRLSAADHPIELHLDSRLPILMSDADRLTQVVTNLVSNAIKYSPSGGVVELRTEHAERSVTLTVRDHGIGIAPEQLETIFERYSRVDTSETRSIQGTGLGLPIVRQIVGLCDGRVWATSESGEGSILHVELPLLQSTAAAPVAA